MGIPSQFSARLAFGPFELDPKAGELLKEGVRIRLPGQAFQILLILLGHAGDLVSRDRLREEIWKDGTFVDFEHSLNVAMNRLRRALGDSAEKPRYIETVPGRGYRFIGSLRDPSNPVPGLSGTARGGSLVLIRTETAGSEEEAQAEIPRSTMKRWIALGASVTVAALTWGIFLYFHRTPALTGKDTIILADFTNTTGDSVFDDTLRQGLAVQLQQSPFLSLIPEERIQEILRLMGQPPGKRLTPDLAQEICERTGSAAVLQGSIVSLGTQYVLGLTAKNCTTGEILDREQAQAGRKEDVLNALSQIAGKFRTRAGESLATVARHSIPLAEATTSSLDALKAYSLGVRVMSRFGDADAVPLFQRAIGLDPQFAMAHAFLGRADGDLGEAALSAKSTSVAYKLRSRASDRERFWITAAYDTQVTENLENARQTCEVWARTYPREPIPHDMLAGIIDPVLAQYEQAVAESRKAIELDPDFGISHYLLAVREQNLGHLDEARKAIRAAFARKVDIPDVLLAQYDLQFVENDAPGMDRTIASSQRKTPAEEWISQHRGSVRAYSGRLQRARDVARYASELALHANHREAAALYEAGTALWEGFFGNGSAAARRALASLQLSNDRGVEYGAALALALAGDSATSRALANDLAKRFPEDTSVRFSYLPALRGRLALNEGNRSKALDLLESAIPHELSTPRTAIHANFGALYPVYIRGEAYLALHRGPDAAAEFQKILDHRGIVVSDPIGALAHLQLGRAFHLAGNSEKAKLAYRDFLTLWKDADPGIPILKQAKAEYSKLQ